jgi:hypothetical protein
LVGATGLTVLTFPLPLADASEPSLTAWISAFLLVLACVACFLHGFFLAAKGRTTARLLALGAADAALGALFALLARPENLENGSGFLLSFALLLANLFRIVAAASVGISLARHVGSVGAPCS